VPRIAVVLPARNEADRIVGCLDSLEPYRRAGDAIVVVDAGSSDATAALAARPGITVLRSAGPRGLAVAAGYEAVAAGADLVLLAHADMRFRPESRERLLAALRARPAAVGAVLGHCIGDRRRRFRLVESGNRLRAGLLQLPYGDQAMVVRTSAVRAAGGFPRQALLEDLELALRLRRLGQWLLLDCPVEIDARHWRGGVIRATLRNWTIVARYIAVDRRNVCATQRPAGASPRAAGL
jgi:GT2 family glycosyltransferase